MVILTTYNDKWLWFGLKWSDLNELYIFEISEKFPFKWYIVYHKLNKNWWWRLQKLWEDFFILHFFLVLSRSGTKRSKVTSFLAWKVIWAPRLVFFIKTPKVMCQIAILNFMEISWPSMGFCRFKPKGDLEFYLLLINL